MKKIYSKPAMRVVMLQHHTQLLQSSVRSLGTNIDDDNDDDNDGEDDFIWGGGGNTGAR